MRGDCGVAVYKVFVVPKLMDYLYRARLETL
jgi:hypothetical protein